MNGGGRRESSRGTAGESIRRTERLTRCSQRSPCFRPYKLGAPLGTTLLFLHLPSFPFAFSKNLANPKQRDWKIFYLFFLFHLDPLKSIGLRTTELCGTAVQRCSGTAYDPKFPFIIIIVIIQKLDVGFCSPWLLRKCRNRKEKKRKERKIKNFNFRFKLVLKLLTVW